MSLTIGDAETKHLYMSNSLPNTLRNPSRDLGRKPVVNSRKSAVVNGVSKHTKPVFH